MKTWLYPIALALAIASGAFLLASAGLLVFAQTQGKVGALVNSNVRMQLIEELHKRPKDEALKQRIRQLDLQLRQKTFTQLRLSANCARAMLVALATFLVCAHFLRAQHRQEPNPLAWGARQPQQEKQATRIARWAAAALFGLLAAMAVWLGTAPARLPERAPAMAETSEPPLTVAEWEQNWPAFRGPWSAGTYRKAVSLTLKWKTPVPLPGMSSPVVWGNTIFLTGGNEKNGHVFCFDADTGKLRWSSEVKVSGPLPPPPKLYEETGMAAPTPATDGHRVYAIFANGNVAAFDFNGKQVWARNLGALESAYGYSSSLTLWQDRLLIQLDLGHEEDGKSSMLALDTRTGRVVWQKPRPTGGSWASPILAMISGKPQVITCGDPWVIAYDPVSGNELWRANGLGSDLAPSPIVASNLVIALKVNAEVLAIRATGTGDVTQTHIAWKTTDGAPDVPSPLFDGKYLYLLGGGGLLQCCDITNGKEKWAHDFAEEFYSSPALAGNILLTITRKGKIFLSEVGETFQPRGTHELGEPCSTSPAFHGARMYLRGKQHLFCFGE